MEFDLAKDGTIGLESAFGALGTVLPLEVIIEKLTASKLIFNLKPNKIAVGNKAEISLFTTTEEWTFTKESIQSKSKNFGVSWPKKLKEKRSNLQQRSIGTQQIILSKNKK